VKRTLPVFSLLFIFFSFIIACTRIDTTELGSELIPVVDNVNTFDTTLEVISDNMLMADSIRVISTDDAPVGEIFNDPVFGQTVSNLFFTIYPNPAGGRPNHPFNAPDSVKGIDSVVLQLAFTGIYGDSTSVQTFRVEEIAQSSNFKDSNYYQGTGNFATAGVLGSKVVDFTKLNDSIRLIRKRDTSYVTNVLRIPLSTSFGTRLKNYDTTATSNGGFRSDSIFSTLLRGLAITVDSNKASNRALAYFNLADTKSRLFVYYRTQRGGNIDTGVAEFTHNGQQIIAGNVTARSGRASTIRRTPAGAYLAALTNGTSNDAELYIQGSPGSTAFLQIPGLSTMSNRVIHLAQLIVRRIPSPGDNLYTQPNLFLQKETLDKDSAITVQNDFILSSDGSSLPIGNFSSFGGFLKSDQTYRFNLTRHVQGIVTRKEPNYNFQLYAPFETTPFYLPPGKLSAYAPSSLTQIPITVNPYLGYGRVAVWGGAAPDPGNKLRLRIIYSKI
jgi:hypothetical protein